MKILSILFLMVFVGAGLSLQFTEDPNVIVSHKIIPAWYEVFNETGDGTFTRYLNSTGTTQFIDFKIIKLNETDFAIKGEFKADKLAELDACIKTKTPACTTKLANETKTDKADISKINLKDYAIVLKTPKLTSDKASVDVSKGNFTFNIHIPVWENGLVFGISDRISNTTYFWTGTDCDVQTGLDYNGDQLDVNCSIVISNGGWINMTNGVLNISQTGNDQWRINVTSTGTLVMNASNFTSNFNTRLYNYGNATLLDTYSNDKTFITTYNNSRTIFDNTNLHRTDGWDAALAGSTLSIGAGSFFTFTNIVFKRFDSPNSPNLNWTGNLDIAYPLSTTGFIRYSDGTNITYTNLSSNGQNTINSANGGYAENARVYMWQLSTGNFELHNVSSGSSPRFGSGSVTDWYDSVSVISGYGGSSTTANIRFHNTNITGGRADGLVNLSFDCGTVLMYKSGWDSLGGAANAPTINGCLDIRVPSPTGANGWRRYYPVNVTNGDATTNVTLKDNDQTTVLGSCLTDANGWNARCFNYSVNSTTWNIERGVYVNDIWMMNITFATNTSIRGLNMTLEAGGDTIKPLVTIEQPINQWYSTNPPLNFTATDETGISACWYSLDNWATNTTIASCLNTTISGSAQGSNTVKIGVNDTSNNLNDTASATYSYDTLNPTVTILSPANSTFYQNWVNLTTTITDTGIGLNTTECYYSLDGFLNNQSFNCTYINVTGFATGAHTINITARDLLNHYNSTEGISFTLQELNINYADPTPADLATFNVSQSAYINFTVNNSTAIDTFKIGWNGTNYTAYDSSLLLSLHLNGDATDESKYANTMTVVNATLNASIFGQGYEFNGTNTRIYSPASQLFNVTKTPAFTVSGWMYRKGDGSGTWQPLMEKVQQWRFVYDEAQNRTVFGYLNTTSNWTQYYGTTNSLPINNWYFLVAVFNDSGNLTTYINGVKQATAALNGNIKDTNGDISIGTLDSYTEVFNGTIDEVRFWNRSLSADEIAFYYNKEVGKYWLNSTNMTAGTYTYFGWVNDSLGQSAVTATRSFTVSAGGVSCQITIDTTWNTNTACTLLNVTGNAILTLNNMNLTNTGRIAIESGSMIVKDANSRIEVI